MIYTPGKVPEIWRPGLGKMIKAGSDLVLQIHYTTKGRKPRTIPRWVWFSPRKSRPERALTIGGNNLGFKIPPGRGQLQVEAKNVFPNGATILNFFPHMHLRGKSFEYTGGLSGRAVGISAASSGLRFLLATRLSTRAAADHSARDYRSCARHGTIIRRTIRRIRIRRRRCDSASRAGKR